MQKLVLLENQLLTNGRTKTSGFCMHAAAEASAIFFYVMCNVYVHASGGTAHICFSVVIKCDIIECIML